MRQEVSVNSNFSNFNCNIEGSELVNAHSVPNNESSRLYESWGNTCNMCEEEGFRWVPLETVQNILPETMGGHSIKEDEDGSLLAMRWPKRCTSCDTKNKKMTRTKKLLEKIRAHSNKRKWRPKLITFSYLSQWEYWNDPQRDILKLKSNLKKARNILKANGIRGGAYVLETKTKSAKMCLFPRRGEYDEGQTMYYHHPHVHMIAVCPFLDQEELAELDNQLLHSDFGAINIKAVNYDKDAATYDWHVSNYLAKYLIKQGGRVSSFGCMTKRR